MSQPSTELAELPRDDAITRLVAELGPRLYNVSLRMCGTPAEAEDLVQDIFLQAWRKWDQFEGRSKVSTWLYTIAARACQRKHRRKSGEPEETLSLDGDLPSGEPLMAVIPAAGADAESEALRAEAIERVQCAIVQLPPEFRLVVIFKEVLGLSVAETAEAIGIKPETVKTRLHRARLRLRKEMVSCLPQQDAPMPSYSQQVCLDLLAAKQEALDRGEASFPVAERDISARCQSVAASLDLTQEACKQIANGQLPAGFQQRLLEGIGAAT